MNFGSSNKLMYDNCAYQKRIYESTSPLKYMLYQGAYESCQKCKQGGNYVIWSDLVDVETELRNQTRPLSQCAQFKYQPANAPVYPSIAPPTLCQIVHNNIPKHDNPGYTLHPADFCGGDTGSNCARKLW